MLKYLNKTLIDLNVDSHFTQMRITIYSKGPHLLRISGECLKLLFIVSGVEIYDNCVWKDVTFFYILNVSC